MTPLRRVVAVVLALLGAASPACRAAPPERILRVAYQGDMQSFDPDNAIPLYGLDALRAVYQGLVQYAPGTTRIEGWLADRWTISPDRLTYTFHLHDGVRFHDGQTMSSADVLAYFERRRTPGFALAYFLDGVAEMLAPDPLTFVIRLAAPQPAFLDRLASGWGPKVVGPGALVGHSGADHATSWLNEHADGTGPFELAEFSRGQRYVLARNPSYWGPAPYFDRIEIFIIPELSEQVMMLQRGGLDLVLHGYPFEQLSKLPPGLSMLAFDDLGLEMAYLNLTRTLRDRSVREAVVTAIDPHRWLRYAFGSFATPALALYPRAMITPEHPVVFPGDLDGARNAIAAAGAVALEIGYSDQEEAVQERPAELLVSALHEIGVSATIREVPLDQTFHFAEDPSRAPDVWLAQNYPDAAHPATQAELFFATGGPLNLFGYSNPTVDASIKVAGLEDDVVRRDRDYADLGGTLFADAAFVPLADIKDVIVYRSGLVGLDPRPALPWAADFATMRRE